MATKETAKELAPDEIRVVAERLRLAYPYIERRKAEEGVLNDSPLDSLVRAMLSQNTNDRNRDRAFNALKGRYSSWEEIADAPPTELAEVIRPVNYSFTKAERILQILQALYQQHQAYTLDILRDWHTERVLSYLQSFPGVGAKSAAIVCLFALKRPVIPVDTHVFRVTGRLGWIPETATPGRAHVILQRLLPAELIFPLHLGLWEHGRLTCRPEPNCAQCAIYEFCCFTTKTAPRPPLELAISITAAAGDVST